MPKEIHRTDFLVLRKLPHLGANLIISGISPEYGHLTFYLKHAAGGNSHHFQFFDVFRLLTLDFSCGRASDFCRCQDAEPIADYSAIAQDYPSFQTACDLSRFCLDNIPSDAPCPETFRAICVALARLQTKSQPKEAVLTGFFLNYLLEGGWLDTSSLTPREQAQCRILIEMGAGGDMPALSAEIWGKLWDWTRLQLRRTELSLPPGFRDMP